MLERDGRTATSGTFHGEPPAFPATAEQVARTPSPGQCIRILRRSVSYMPDLDPPYFVTWEYEVINEPEPPQRKRAFWARWSR